MTGDFQLIKIINQAIKLEARNIYFRLDPNTGLILVELREGKILLPYSRLTPDDYKQILDYIELHISFDLSHKGQPQGGIINFSQNSGSFDETSLLYFQQLQ